MAMTGQDGRQEEHRGLWLAVAPYLRSRKGDVHVPIAYRYAERLADAHPDCDRDVVLAAILLHDVGWALVDEEAMRREGHVAGRMRSAIRYAHEREGARVARELLPALGYRPETVDEVVEIVDGHDTRTEALSLNDSLVKDADKLWRFDVVGISVACDWFSMTPAQFARQVGGQIEDLFTEAAREIARTEFARARDLLRLDVLGESAGDAESR
jgi:hypothetical protein